MKRLILILVVPALMAVVYRGILESTDPSMHDQVRKYATLVVVGSFVLVAVLRILAAKRTSFRGRDSEP